MKNNFSIRVKEIISISRDEAIRLGNSHIGPEHLLLGLITQQNNQAILILRNLEINLERLAEELEISLKVHGELEVPNPRQIPLNREAERVIRGMGEIAKTCDSPSIEPEHLVLTILKNQGFKSAQILRQFGVSYYSFDKALVKVKSFAVGAKGIKDVSEQGEKPKREMGRDGGFLEIFRFEINYRLKRPDTYLYFISFFLIVTLSFANGAVPENDLVFVNSPIVLLKFFSVFSLFMMVVTAAIMGAPLYRDLEYSTHEYYLAYPISQNGYFWGRFLGSFLFVYIDSIKSKV